MNRKKLFRVFLWSAFIGIVFYVEISQFFLLVDKVNSQNKLNEGPSINSNVHGSLTDNIVTGHGTFKFK